MGGISTIELRVRGVKYPPYFLSDTSISIVHLEADYSESSFFSEIIRRPDEKTFHYSWSKPEKSDYCDWKSDRGILLLK